MDLRGELERTLDNYKLEKVLREELNTGLIEVFKRIPKWISTTDRLPEKDGSYLVRFGNGLITTDTFIAFEDGHTKWYDGGDDIGGITHWMPLPKAPEE